MSGMDREMLNVRAVMPLGDGVLGPGRRVAVWFQGCSLGCGGCIVPELQPTVPFELVDADRLFARVKETEPGTGEITISGGEPFEQPREEFLRFLELLDSDGFGIWVYSGYVIEELMHAGRQRELALMDTLVDGRYIAGKDDGVALRGSSNQRIIMLSDRYAGIPLPGSRKIEVSVNDREVSVAGIPPAGFWKEFTGRLSSFNG
jgi:anaerobic ribonucleoside-triphosphate reductase activating protein